MGRWKAALGLVALLNCVPQWHNHIMTTVFWVGEEATRENDYIPNNVSSWDEQWQQHYGGLDDPDQRKGFFPAAFMPKENPFYFALPAGKEGEPWPKNRWIEIAYNKNSREFLGLKIPFEIFNNGRHCYAQWEDVGPWEDDDYAYVFGYARPKNKENNNGAALDVSPAVRDYLGIDTDAMGDYTSWRFVPADDVPDGPWKEIVTK